MGFPQSSAAPESVYGMSGMSFVHRQDAQAVILAPAFFANQAYSQQ